MNMADSDEFSLSAQDFRPAYSGMRRAECLLVEADGTLYASAMPNGVLRIDPDGQRRLLGNIDGVPNGIALDLNGDLLVTDIENRRLWRVRPDGKQELVLDRIDGQPLGAVNFAMVDRAGTIWITVSTRKVPRSDALAQPCPDGYIIKLDTNGARVVAEGLLFANEARMDAEEAFLYVAETAAGHISRYRLDENRNPTEREIFGPSPLFDGARVDGIAFDSRGNLWVTELSRNGLHILRPNGEHVCVFEDVDGVVLRQPTSVAFGGPDLKTVYVGSLVMETILSFQAPYAGAPLTHRRASIATASPGSGDVSQARDQARTAT